MSQCLRTLPPQKHHVSWRGKPLLNHNFKVLNGNGGLPEQEVCPLDTEPPKELAEDTEPPKEPEPAKESGTEPAKEPDTEPVKEPDTEPPKEPTSTDSPASVQTVPDAALALAASANTVTQVPPAQLTPTQVCSSGALGRGQESGSQPEPSEAAIDRRLRRLLQPTARQGHRLAENIREMWDTNKGQLFKMFKACGNDADRVCKA